MIDEKQTPATKPAPRVTSRETPGEEIRSRARLFVKEMYSRLSRTNAVEWLGPLYADEIVFHGKVISKGEVRTVQRLLTRSEVVAIERLFIEKWPERSFSIQDKAMTTTCGENRPQVPLECIVTGTVDWTRRSVHAAESGHDGFTYVLRPSGDTFIIKEEHQVRRQ
jgi:hypothetical protein